MRRQRISRNARGGVMLLIVTLVLTALTLSGAALLTLMKTEKEATFTRGRKELVHGVARSAVVFLESAVEQTPEEREKLGGLYDNNQYFCARPLLTADEGGEDTSRFTILSPKLEDSHIDGIRYGLVDESSRLNLQAVLEWDKEAPGAGRTALMKLPGMTRVAADSILDWIDPDEQARQNGAEARYYADAKLPYSPRNATPVFLEELLLARGVTRAQLYGSDENFTYNAENSAQEQENSALGGSLSGAPAANTRSYSVTTDVVPWTDLMTVFSAEKDVDPKGEARVDLNGDNLEFLYQELQSRVGADVAKFVVLYRQYGPENAGDDEDAAQDPAAGRANRRVSGYSQGGRNAGQNGAQGGRNAGRRSGYIQGGANQNANASADGVTTGTLAQAPLDYNTAATTTLKTPLDIVGARVVINGVAYPSPLQDSKENANVQKIMTLLDYASTNGSTTIVGRVNVNAAPRAVLSAIPGLSTAEVQRIIDDRPDMSKALPADYRHAFWLYTKGIVDLTTMKSLYNKTTARGDVFRGQIVGFLDNSNEIERAEVVVDGTTEPPRQVFYKDLSTLGKGFSDATLLGGTVGDESGNGSDEVGPLDWQGATGLVDIEREQSGYLNSSAGDLFDAVEASGGLVPSATSSDTTGGALTGGLSDPLAAPTAAPTAMTSDAATGVLTGNATDPMTAATLGTGADAGADAATGTSANGGGAESRRDRMLNALQSARQTRQTRNGRLGGNNADEPAAGDAAETATEDAASDAGGGATARGGRGNAGGENANADNGAAQGGRRGGGNRGGDAQNNAGADDSNAGSDRTQNALDALRGARGGGRRNGSGT